MAFKFLADDVLQIGDTRYTATLGLFELLFKKNPAGYTNKDIENYTKILYRSKAAFKDDFDTLKGSRAEKYRKIICPHMKNFMNHFVKQKCRSKKSQIDKSANEEKSEEEEEGEEGPDLYTTTNSNSRNPLSDTITELLLHHI